MTVQSHDDTHSRIRALETQSERNNRALETMAEAQQETARQIAELAIYLRQHDKTADRMGKRLEEIEKDAVERDKETRAKFAKIDKLTNTGYGVWIVICAFIMFGSKYVVDGFLNLNRTDHVFDKRIELIEHELRGGGIKASLTTDDTCPKPEDPKPKPKPEQAWTNKPGI